MGDERDEWAETVRILWEPPAKPRRGPKPALSLDLIARAAVGIADAEGLAALSMQRLAERIGFTKMSLYRYVPGRAELVALMVDTAIGEAPAGDPDRGHWRDRLSAWSHGLVTVFQEHPWLLDATTGVRVMGPRELDWMERALSALDGTGLSGGERMDAVVLLTSHVRGIAQQSRAAGRTGDPEKQLATVLGRLLDAHGERYPALGAALAAAAAPGEQDQALEFGLQRVLDGLEALVARRAG